MLARFFRGPSDADRRADTGRLESWWQTRQYSPSIAVHSVTRWSQVRVVLQAIHMTEFVSNPWASG